MLKQLLFLIICFVTLKGFAQTYTPIVVTGYNHDVIAEGTGSSSLAITTMEMDAISPSNFVLCTQDFANANGLPSGYGIPNNGTITSGTKSYQLSYLGDGTTTFNNALYLFKNENGSLTLSTPGTFSNLSFLILATEGNATVNITVNYTDGTNQSFNNVTFIDWIGTSPAILFGFGRLKRMVGPFGTGTYEQAPTNPRFYSTEVAVNCSKMVSSIDFTNVSPGTNLGSNRSFVFAVSGSQAALPLSPLSNGDTICAGQSTVLNVPSPVAGISYSWYNAATGGGAVGTGTSFTTPTLNATTVYYVQGSNSGGCTSGRTPDTVTVLPPPVAPTAAAAQICPSQTVILAVTNPLAGITYSWYATATGGTALSTTDTYTTPVLNTTTTYYLQATNAAGCVNTVRTTVTVSVLPALSNPLIADVQVCSGQTSTLSVTTPDPNNTYTWYDAATGGTVVFTGISFTTPAITSTTTYYVQASSTGGCNSGVTPVLVSVLPALSNPLIPTVNVCSGQSTIISITSPDPTYTYTWYDASTGGNVVFTGTIFTTPIIIATTTYYVQASNAGSCPSGITPVTVSVLPALTDPLIPAVNVCYGQPATVSITLPDPAYTYTWYDAATGGTILFTGTTFTTPAITAATTYYVQASNAGGCNSGVVPVTVSVLPSLANAVIPGVNICSGQSANIVISSADPSYTYTWYDAATGGTIVFTGTTFVTPAITTTTTYYVQASNAGGCTSGVVSVTATIVPPPAGPIASGEEICSGQTAIISISNPDPAVVYTYYSTLTGGVSLGTGTTFTTPPLTVPTVYFIEAGNATGCISTTRTQVNISIASPVASPVVTTSNITVSSVTFNWNPIPGATGYQVSVNGGVFTIPSSGSNGTTHTVTGLPSAQAVAFSVRALGGQTCQNSAVTIATAVTLATEIFVPNVFTPNADGKNDFFLIYGNDITAIDLKIFSQWGEMIYASRDNTRGWDGTYKGKKQPIGVYVYVVNVTLRNGSKVDRKGSISLVR